MQFIFIQDEKDVIILYKIKNKIPLIICVLISSWNIYTLNKKKTSLGKSEIEYRR